MNEMRLRARRGVGIGWSRTWEAMLMHTGKKEMKYHINA